MGATRGEGKAIHVSRIIDATSLIQPAGSPTATLLRLLLPYRSRARLPLRTNSQLRGPRTSPGIRFDPHHLEQAPKALGTSGRDVPAASPDLNSEVATGGVYKRQGLNRHRLVTGAY